MVKLEEKGKRNKYKLRKMQSLTVSECFTLLGDPNRSSKIFGCGSWLKFLECREHDVQKLSNADFCRQRLCPMCQFRKSRKIADQVRVIAHHAHQKYPTYRYLFLTLTIPNVSGNELSASVDGLFKSYKRLMERKEVQVVVKGSFRSLEVKYNAERDDFHPHFHCLLLVPPSYFAKNYIKRNRWLTLWQEATKDFTITQVDIRTIKLKNLRKDVKPVEAFNEAIGKAAAESAKYLTKPGDYLKESLPEEKKAEIIGYLHGALKGRRIHAYGGIFKELKSQLGLLDIENDESNLIDIEELDKCLCSVCQSELKEYVYTWLSARGDYVQTGGAYRPEKLLKLEEKEKHEERLAIMEEGQAEPEAIKQVQQTRLSTGKAPVSRVDSRKNVEFNI